MECQLWNYVGTNSTTQLIDMQMEIESIKLPIDAFLHCHWTDKIVVNDVKKIALESINTVFE